MTPKEELERKIKLLDQGIGLMRNELEEKIDKYHKITRKRLVLIEKLTLLEK